MSFLTRQQQLALLVVIGLLLTGMAVKAYRANQATGGVATSVSER